MRQGLTILCLSQPLTLCLAFHWHLIRKKESEVAQSCLTLCDPMDSSLPGSTVNGIFQARILEWVASSFSRESSLPRNQTQVFCTAGMLFTVWATREAQTKEGPTKIWTQITGFKVQSAQHYTLNNSWLNQRTSLGRKLLVVWFGPCWFWEVKGI